MAENEPGQTGGEQFVYTVQIPSFTQQPMAPAPAAAPPVAMPVIREPTPEERAFGERITELLNAITDLANTLALHDLTNVQDEGVKEVLKAAREVVKAAWRLQRLMREAATRVAARGQRTAGTVAPSVG